MQLIIDGEIAVLRSRATPALVALLPRLEGRRRWGQNSELHFEATQHNIDVIATLPGVEIIRQQPLVIEQRKPTNYESKSKPYPHQIRLRELIGSRKTFAVFGEQGTGKTKSAIDWVGELWAAGHVTGALVVSKKGVHRQWIDSEIQDHCGVDWQGTWWPNKPDHLPRRKLQWFAINYDALRSDKTMAVCLQFCKLHAGRLAIICDESQEIKNHRSIRHKKVEELKKYSSHRMILTGTPIAKDLTDEWAQLKWLNEDIIGVRYLTTFRNEYCIMGGFENRAVVGHKNLERFQQLVAPWSFRITKSEIGILPKQYKRWTFDLTAQQREIIRELKSELEVVLAEHDLTVSAENAAVMLGKLQQVACGFIASEAGVTRLMPAADNPRIQALLEWLGQDEGEKAVIWARFREDMRTIAEALQGAGITFAQYHGGVSDKDRQKAKESFMDPEGCQVFLSNPQSGGTGLNLQGLCSRVLYYSNSFSYLDRAQSEDRTHRIGTKGIVTYTDLIATSSIDGYIASNLRKKRGLSQLVLGDLRTMIGEM